MLRTVEDKRSTSRRYRRESVNSYPFLSSIVGDRGSKLYQYEVEDGHVDYHPDDFSEDDEDKIYDELKKLKDSFKIVTIDGGVDELSSLINQPSGYPFIAAVLDDMEHTLGCTLYFFKSKEDYNTVVKLIDFTPSY